MFCVYCGCKNINGALFCKECGEEIALTESDGATQGESLPSMEDSKSTIDKSAPKPSVRDRDILHCDSIAQVERQKRRHLMETIASLPVGIIVFQLLFYYVYNQFNDFEQLQLDYNYHINPTTALIVISAYFIFAALLQFVIASIKRPKDVVEQLHITPHGIWGVAYRNVEFTCTYSEIKSISATDKLPLKVKREVNWTPRDKHALTIKTKSQGSLQFFLLGKEQIGLVCSTLNSLVEETGK